MKRGFSIIGCPAEYGFQPQKHVWYFRITWDSLLRGLESSGRAKILCSASVFAGNVNAGKLADAAVDFSALYTANPRVKCLGEMENQS